MYQNVKTTVAPTIAGPFSVDEPVVATDKLSLPVTSGQTTSASNSGHATSSNPQQTRSRPQLNRSKTSQQTQNNRTSTLPSSTVYHRQSNPDRRTVPKSSPRTTTEPRGAKRRNKTQRDGAVGSNGMGTMRRNCTEEVKQQGPVLPRPLPVLRA